MNIKSNKGSAVLTTPIVIAISLFLLALLTVFCVNYLMPFIWYEKLSSHSLKYIFVMEEYGYLTPDERNNLLNDVASAGFNTNEITINATNAPEEYGEPIFLDIYYNYKMALPVLDNGRLSAAKQENIVQMNIRKQSISKR